MLRIAAISMALLLAPVSTVNAAQPPLARMDEVVRSFVGMNQFMGAVLVEKDGKVIFDKAYGSADLEWNIPNTTDTKFRIGSITKQFTAAAIVLLEERGKLKFDDEIGQHLHGLPLAWQKATIAQLLHHTSGIYNFTRLQELEWTRPTLSYEWMIARIKDRPLDFAPGEKFAYSNTGYMLLSMLIEKISDQTYAQFLQDNIFTPLGMKDSGFDTNAAILANRARGYERKDGALINASFIDMTNTYGAGGLYSTTHDLLTWQKALFAGKVVKPASFKIMTTPAKEDYGFGLVLRSNDGHRRIWHNGGINGFTSNLVTLPDDRLTVIVLNNAQGPTDGITDNLTALMLGRTVILPSERKEVAVDEKTLARYVGRYEMRPDFIFEITLENGKLISQASKQNKVSIFAESEKKFFTRTFDSQITFVTEGDGPATSLILHQRGRDMTAKRLP
jgi:CubicO group peptidase (beta-lactamase class C family)